LNWNVLCIAAGASLGANLRYAVTLWSVQRWGTSFPYGTLMINVLGSFLVGIVLTWATTKGAMTEATKLFLVTGFLGGFTTFSTFSYESLSLAANSDWHYPVLYVGGSVGLGILAAFAGMAVGRAL
jgi:CrcB protein